MNKIKLSYHKNPQSMDIIILLAKSMDVLSLEIIF